MRKHEKRELIVLIRAHVMTVLLIGAAFGSARQSTIPLSDTSRNGCPVALSGTVTANDDTEKKLHSLKATISVTNLSHKTIVLMVTEVNVTGLAKKALHETRKDDYFFGTEGFNPGATQILESS